MTPQYYLLADGTSFYRWVRKELSPYLSDLDKDEYHCMISAAEHLFRQGRKGGMEIHDEQAQRFWFSASRDFFVERRAKADPEKSKQRHENEFNALQRLVVSRVVEERERVNQLEGARK